METRKAILSRDVEKITAPHSTTLKEIDVIEKSIQDFAFSYNREILKGRAEVALEILENWQPIIFSEKPEIKEEKLISDEYIWLEDILVAALMGWPPTLIETLCLYASDYPEGINKENLTISDKIGLELWAIFASLPTSISTTLPNLASTTLIDDYHDTTPKRGEEFILEVADLLLDLGIIKEDDIPGRDYVLLRESSMLGRSQEILALLEASGGEVTFLENESRFIPPENFWQSSEILSKSRRKQIRRQGVLLFENNKPSCPLMDAAAYLRAVNYHYLHVKIFPESYRYQQDDTYALLHATKIVPKGQYHNLFFEEDPSALVAIIGFLKSGLKKIIEKETSYTAWANFPNKEYAEENYLPGVGERDKEIIDFVSKELAELTREKKPKAALDLGAGGNLYPSILWTPFVEEDIEIWEYSENGRRWLREEIEKKEWLPFADYIAKTTEFQKDLWPEFKNKAAIRYGSVSDLLEIEVDAVSAFFVSERITNHRVYLRMMVRRMVESLKEDGIFVFAHATDSEPYQIKETQGLFPSVSINEDLLKKVYNALPVEYSVKYIKKENADIENASGIIVFVGKKVKSPVERQGIINP